jgi:multidrug resistance protein MdtO
VKATWTQALEIVRFSEGYRLYAAPGDTFLRRCAGSLEAYADDIDQQQAPVPFGELRPDPGNPLAPAGHPADDIAELVVRTFTAFATGR